jgi:hypothetical protein
VTRPWGLAVTLATLFGLRVAVVLWVPDTDLDGYGHYKIAQVLSRDPCNLAAHWVWLPLYHYLLAGLLRLHANYTVIRLLSATLGLVAPVLVAKRAQALKDPWRLAAWATALCPLPALLSVSAQQETLFGVLLLGCALTIDTQRPVAAGFCLGAACLVRYEAWGIVGLALAHAVGVGLLRQRLPQRALGWAQGHAAWPLRALLFPTACIFGFLLAHRWADGRWFAAQEELRRFTHMQRVVLSRGAAMDLLWFPVILPLLTFGPFALAMPLGLGRRLHRGSLVPLGIVLFLAASWLSKGSLGSLRYLCSLAPFGCALMARGLQTRAKLVLPFLSSLALLQLGWFVHDGVDARHRQAELRQAERSLQL